MQGFKTVTLAPAPPVFGPEESGSHGKHFYCTHSVTSAISATGPLTPGVFTATPGGGYYPLFPLYR